MQRVFVLDRHKQPLAPCNPARARQLLRMGKAAVYRRYPFTIILGERVGGETQPVMFKVDPGSQTTGIALVQANGASKQRVIWAAELTHKGEMIRASLLARRSIRNNRRQRKTRYRAARFKNRKRVERWLPPSLQSRLNNIRTWVIRLQRIAPIKTLSMELVRFDTHAIQNPEIAGVEYRQGELQGYEIREYLLEKWGHQCAYCHKTGVLLEVEHILPKSRGGSDRVKNLTIACRRCNLLKDNQTAEEFGYPHIQEQARIPMRDAAAMNASRWALWRLLKELELPLEVGTGGRTAYNRIKQNYPKAHWIDAVCVGRSGATVYIANNHKPLMIKAIGRGTRQMCRMNKYGFPRTRPKQMKRVNGFQTGDFVRALIPSGKNVGIHIGRITVRTKGVFHIGKVDGIGWKFCQLLQRADGYEYVKGECAHFVPQSIRG